MGWTYMEAPHDQSAKQCLDREFNSDTSQVVDSAMVGDTYYAAVRTKTGAVVGVVAATEAQGGVFGYKDMDETMGPVASDCPTAILDLLDPTDDAYALKWRARCRERAARRR